MKKYFFKIVLLAFPLGIVLIYTLISNGISYAKQTNTSLGSLPSIFRDKTNQTSLALQVTFGRPDTGRFEFYVPQVGYYRGIIPLQQSGKQIIHPQGIVTAQFYPLDDSSTVQPTTVRMTGEINTSHNSASIDIWVNNNHYNLKTPEGDIVAGTVSAKQVLSFTASQNWSALYGLLTNEIQSSVTPTQFTQLMANNSSSVVTEAVLTGSGQIKIAAGNTYFVQPVSLTVKQTNNTTVTYTSTEYFVLEQGTWRLLTTDTPTP